MTTLVGEIRKYLKADLIYLAWFKRAMGYRVVHYGHDYLVLLTGQVLNYNGELINRRIICPCKEQGGDP